MPRNRFLEGLGRGVLRLGGWRMGGAFPDLPKFVLIAAPHSSNWDGVWGVAVKLGMGVKLSILGKDALVKAPLPITFLRIDCAEGRGQIGACRCLGQDSLGGGGCAHGGR